MSSRARWCGVLGAIVWAFACAHLAHARSPLGTTTLAAAGMEFEAQEDHVLYASLEAALAHMAKGPGWRQAPYEALGNFVQTWWCKGSGAPESCSYSESTADRRDQHLLSLYALRYPDRAPTTVFGVGASAHRMPSGAGWGVHISLSLRGKTIIGDGFHLDLRRYGGKGTDVEFALHLGSTMEYTVGKTTITESLPGDSVMQALALMASPEAMARTSIGQLDTLEGKVRGVLDDDSARTCEYEPYEGGGVPPRCTLRPLTKGEVESERARAATWFSERRAILLRDSRAVYEAAAQAFPFAALNPAPVNGPTQGQEKAP